MKYRIKIEHLNSGQKKYTPQAKKHLFGKWENVVEFSTSKTMRYIYDSEEEASNVIERLKEFLDGEWGNKVKTITYKQYGVDNE
jgi:hypothetical protein